MYCAYCNSKIFDEDRTCPNCGAPTKDSVEKASTKLPGNYIIENSSFESTSVRGGHGNQLQYVYYHHQPSPYYVKVRSLIAHKLNLSTEDFGRGNVYSFNGVGDTKDIPLEDVVKINKLHKNFLDEGFL